MDLQRRMVHDSAAWHVVKYMPDARRREPRNVGIVLETPDGWLSRFVGEDELGEIKGYRLARDIRPDVYRSWVSYYRRKAASQQWEDVYRHQDRHPVNFITEVGGEISKDSLTWEQLLERVFIEIVADAHGEEIPSEADRQPLNRGLIVRQAKEALHLAGIPYSTKVSVDAVFDDRRTTVPFEFRSSVIMGGEETVSLMDAVTGRGRDPGAPARELRSRITGALSANASQHFITFYSPEMMAAKTLDQVLAPLEQASYAVDVTDADHAAQTLADVFG